MFGVGGTVINFLLVAPLTLMVNNTYGFQLTTKKDVFTPEGQYDKHKLAALEGQHGEEEERRLLNGKTSWENELRFLTEELTSSSTNEAEETTEVSTVETEEKSTTETSIEKQTENVQEESEEESEVNVEVKEKPKTTTKKQKKSTHYSKKHNEPLEVLTFSTNEVLLFASVISATDAVAALAFVKEESDPKLFPILFGEGVVNDAVCIVLYGIIKTFLESGQPFTAKTPFKMANNFLSLFFISLFIAILIGGGSALLFKKIKPLKINRVTELCLLIFFAFISYSGTELLGKSPIVAILFTGVFMSQYCFFNLSFQAREESSVVTKVISTIAEGFVFVYMGLTVMYYFTTAFSISFVIWEFFILLASRIIMVFGTCFILE